MPRMSGISVIKDVKSQFPEVRILALTIHESDEYVLETFKAGVDGYCVKDASRDELMVAIESVLDGKTYISPGIRQPTTSQRSARPLGTYGMCLNTSV